MIIVQSYLRNKTLAVCEYKYNESLWNTNKDLNFCDMQVRYTCFPLISWSLVFIKNNFNVYDFTYKS